MPDINFDQIAWEKVSGLVPAVIQNPKNGHVLMLGYMNRTALTHSIESGKVTFFSRSKNRLWTKGESSGNWLNFVSAEIDCDNDTLLIQAHPQGPTCHRGMVSCFNDTNPGSTLFLAYLEKLISNRRATMPSGSYTTNLFNEGKGRIAQKVGEEGVELAIAHMKDDKTEIANEAADLLYRMMVLLQDADLTLSDAIQVLEKRHK